MIPKPDHGRRIDDIELLRGVAILFVLVEHLYINLISWRSPPVDALRAYFGGWTGVDLFFAISGFVIVRSLGPQLEACADGLAFFNASLVFWVRRAWRLLPSAWLWIVLTLLASAFLNASGAFRPFRSNVEWAVMSVLDVANIHLAEFGWVQRPLGATFPYWSLSLEEQFYLVLPLLIFVLRRRLALFAAAAVVIQFVAPRVYPWQVDMRTDALFLGVLIAIWASRDSYRVLEPKFLAGSRLARGAFFIGLLACLGMLGSPGLDVSPLPIGMVALVSAALVLTASYDRDYLMARGPLKTVMLWFGSRSYALYVTHIPAYFATREIWYRISGPNAYYGGNYSLRYGVTAAILLVAFAELNYRFVETPLRARGAQIGRDLAQRPLRPSTDTIGDPTLA